jgi:hypothetical protein
VCSLTANPGQNQFPNLPINIDLSVNYSPDVVKATDLHANTAPGGATTDLSVAVSHVFPSTTVFARAGMNRVGKQKQTDSDDFEENTYDAHNEYYIDVMAQHRFFDNLFANIGGTLSSAKDVVEHLAYLSDNISFTNKYSYGITYGMHIGASYTIIPHRLAISMSYKHTFVGNTAVSELYPSPSPLGTFAKIGDDSVSLDIRLLAF